MNEKHSMSWYFDRGLERGALLLDASNLEWFTFPLFNNIRKEIYRTLEDPSEDMDWGYSYPGGKTKLRELIASHESYIENANITANDVIINGNGVTGTLNFITQILAKENNFNNKQILYPMPAYEGLKKSIVNYNLKPQLIYTKEENNYMPMLKEIEKVYNDDVIGIILTNPGNPVCTYFEKEELYKILKYCIEKKIYIIYDAIFEESPTFLNLKVEVFNICKNYKKLIKLKGFSKDSPQLGDLRLGWSICKDKSFNDKLIHLGEITNFSNSTFLESLAIVEMQNRVNNDKGFISKEQQQYIKEKQNYHYMIKDILSDTKKYLLTEKNIVEKVYDFHSGNILFIKLKKSVCNNKGIYNSHQLFVYILENLNILITPGHVFGLDIKELCFRVTVSRNKVEFIEGLKTIIQEFEKGVKYD